jgi:hypothetical protein
VRCKCSKFIILLTFGFFFTPSPGLTREEKRTYDRQHDLDTLDDDDPSYEDDVLHGRAPANISHAGKALSSDDMERTDEDLLEVLRTNHRYDFFFVFFCGVLFLMYIYFFRLKQTVRVLPRHAYATGPDPEAC